VSDEIFEHEEADMTPPPLHWAIKLRKRLLIRGTHRWNGWVRDVTAWIERTA
jgi:hypothetical protein